LLFQLFFPVRSRMPENKWNQCSNNLQINTSNVYIPFIILLYTKSMWKSHDWQTEWVMFGNIWGINQYIFISKTLTLTCTCITFWKSYCLKCQNAPMEPFLDWQLTAFQMYSMGESDHCIYQSPTCHIFFLIAINQAIWSDTSYCNLY
jgi:hypothetical protein